MCATCNRDVMEAQRKPPCMWEILDGLRVRLSRRVCRCHRLRLLYCVCCVTWFDLPCPQGACLWLSTSCPLVGSSSAGRVVPSVDFVLSLRGVPVVVGSSCPCSPEDVPVAFHELTFAWCVAPAGLGCLSSLAPAGALREFTQRHLVTV